MACHYNNRTATVDADFGNRIHLAHPNPPMCKETGNPVIDKPVIGMGGGNTVLIQCTLEGSPHSQIETENVTHDAEREIEQSQQSQGCERSIDRIKFRASVKGVELDLMFMCEETRGAGLTEPQKVIITNLVPASVYKIQITQLTRDNQVWKVEQCIPTKAPFGPPVDFQVAKKNEGKFFFSWEKPVVEPDCTIDFYVITIYIYTQSGLHGDETHRIKSKYSNALITLTEGIKYVFEMQACSGDFSSKPSRCQWTTLRHEMSSNGKMVNSLGKPIYLVDAATTDEREYIRLKEVGNESYSDITQKGKVILVLGQTGVGKTTWINTMLNYLLDVNYTDDFRFKLVIEGNAEHQEMSQTQTTTLYRIHHNMRYTIDYTLNLIDTPGFGDTGGIERDKDIAKQLQGILDVHSGFVDHLNAVVFVTKADHRRLDPCQKYILSSITELFGADIAENIYLVFTHSSGVEPPMLSTLKEAKFPHKKYFKFNNAAVFSDIEKMDDETENRDKNTQRLCEVKELYRECLYENAMSNCKNFLLAVQSAPAKGLAKTRHVLKKRMTLRQSISDLNSLVQKCLDKMDELQTVVMATTKLDDEIKQTENYTTENEEVVKEKVPKSKFYGTTVCIECKHTCHRKCLAFFDIMKSTCEVMDRNKSPPSCTKCPNHCIWKYHKNLNYIYEEQLERVTKILSESKKRYEEAQAKKLTAEEVCNNIKIELKATEAKMKSNLSEITESIQELRKIGMKSDESSQIQYIDMLIEQEKQNARPSQKSKLGVLYELRKQVVDMIDIEKGEYDPFRLYREKAKQISEESPNIKELDLWINVANNIKQAAKRTGVVRRVVGYYNSLYGAVILGDKE